MKTLLSLMQVIGPKEVSCRWSICFPDLPRTLELILEQRNQNQEKDVRLYFIFYAAVVRRMFDG